MLESARKIRAVENLDACDIGVISIQNVKYYEGIRSRYARRLEQPYDDFEPEQQQLEGEEARQQLFGMFGSRR